jgi:outer membrane protein TolC
MNKSLGILFFVLAACSAFASTLCASETRILTLQDAVQMTLARSPEVLLAEAQATRAGEALRESRSLNWPQVATGSGLAYNNGYPLSIEGAAPSIVEISASQSIFSKKNANLIREAEESGKVSRLGTESARNDLALKTAWVYYDLHRAGKILALESARLDQARKQQEFVEALLDAGRVRPVEVTQARTATSAAQLQLVKAQEQASFAETELRELTGLPAGVSIKTVEPQIDSPILESPVEMLYKHALESSPEILQAEHSIRAKEFHVEAIKGESLPQLEIVSQYALFSRANNYADYFNRFTRNNALVGLSVQVPLFTGFRLGARVAQSRQEVTELSYKLQGQKSDLRLNIERGSSALRIARAAASLAQSDVKDAGEMFEMSKTLWESGRISSKELEDARAQLQQKELALIEADQVLFQRKLELLHTVGAISSALQ